jgi:hypothetical protein
VGDRAADDGQPGGLQVTGVEPFAGGQVVEMMEVAGHAKKKRAPTMAGARRSSIRAQNEVRKAI